MRQAVRAIMIKDQDMLAMHRNKFGKVFYELVGGGIGVGETAEEALNREVREETSLKIGNIKMVFVEEAGKPYGNQYIYLCEYVGGEPIMQPSSAEAQINKLGKNIYTPVWLPLEKLDKVPFLSKELQDNILKCLESGFPDEPLVFTSNARYDEMIGAK
jgi:8-oxo-dGTP pyrophosphatase MutT (NUDIX family)